MRGLRFFGLPNIHQAFRATGASRMFFLIILFVRNTHWQSWGFPELSAGDFARLSPTLRDRAARRVGEPSELPCLGSVRAQSISLSRSTADHRSIPMSHGPRCL